MKIYKFRPLVTQEDFNRAKNILETGHFWCSKFSELNDPTEGSFHAKTKRLIDTALEHKKRYKICSFSGEKAFSEPIMWGYYANGFRGIAIEVECYEEEVQEIKYEKDIKTIKNYLDISNDVEKILISKLTSWEHENEFRFLKPSNNNFHKIGDITAVYFGNPYGNAVNNEEICNNSQHLPDYKNLKNKLNKLAEGLKIDCHNVKIEFKKMGGCRVVVDEKL